MSFTAPTGINFRTVPDIPVASLRQSLDAITEFLKSRDVHGYVLHFDDWWRRDAKPVSQGALFWENYIDRYRDHAAAEAQPKLGKIEMGIGGAEMEWYKSPCASVPRLHDSGLGESLEEHGNTDQGDQECADHG
jgi:hypothetical protein